MQVSKDLHVSIGIESMCVALSVCRESRIYICPRFFAVEGTYGGFLKVERMLWMKCYLLELASWLTRPFLGESKCYRFIHCNPLQEIRHPDGVLTRANDKKNSLWQISPDRKTSCDRGSKASFAPLFFPPPHPSLEVGGAHAVRAMGGRRVRGARHGERGGATRLLAT